MSSTMSLDSLSSPSPSPSPEPEALQPGPDSTGAGLDSDSELSELTEEEQEAENQNNHQGREEDGFNGRPRRSSRRGGTSSALRSGWGKRRKGEPTNDTVVEEEEEEEMADPPKAMEEEEEEDEEDDSGPSHSRSRLVENDIEDEDEDEGDDAETAPLVDAADEEDHVSGEEERSPPRRRNTQAPRTPPYQDGDLTYPPSARQTNGSDHEEDDDDLSDPPAGPADDAVDSDAGEWDAVDQRPLRERKPPSFGRSPTSGTVPNIDLAFLHPMLRLAPGAAAPSIMAGSTVIDPPSPSSSSTSLSGSPTSPRSPSSAFRVAGKASKQADGDGAAVKSKRDGKQKLNAADKHAEMSSRAPDKLDNENAAAADLEIPEQDGSVEDLEVDDVSPDQDLELELESDLQPAHRAEALDVLATIELKFALLRERVYVEKMEGLAWEEALIGEGTHPELIHLHAELSKRRDKRLELAARKRTYEITSVTKKRSTDENATWSWWKFARDELQTDMISETNRKRRKLERERRAVERPQPVRRIPNPPHDTPNPPTLRKIVKAFPFSGSRRNLARGKRDHRPHSTKTVHPALSTLSASDIASDLQYLFQHRRSSYDQRLTNMHITGMSAQIGPQPLHVYDQYNAGPGMDGLNVPASFGGSRMPPPPAPPFLNQHQPLPIQSTGFLPLSGSGLNRVHHTPLNPHGHNPASQFTLEPELPLIAPSGSGSVPPPHTHFPSQHSYFGSAQGVGQVGHVFPPGAPLGTRRSLSPVPVLPNGLGGAMPGGKQNGGWIGVHHTGAKRSGSGEWMGDGRRDEITVNDGEDDGMRVRESRREKDRMRERSERDREREREQHDLDERERHFHMSQQQQHRHPPPGQHQHVHTPSGQVPHHMLGQHHHHHHHHHHVRHHHHPNASTGGGHGSSAPPPSLGPAPSPPRAIMSREFESGPQTGTRPTEVINLSSKSSMGSSWKGNDPHAPPPEYRERESRKHSSRPSSGPPVVEDRERTLAMPFVMSSTYGMSGNGPPTFASTNGTSSLSAGPSPRGSWNNAEEGGFRIAPSSTGGYLGSAEGHGNSPGHRYATSSGSNFGGRGPSRQNSIGLSPPRPRAVPPSPSSSSAYVPSARSPTRFGPPPPPLPPSHGSPSLKTRRPGSPVLPGKLSVPGSGPSAMYSPVRTTTPATLGPPLEMKTTRVGSRSGSRAGSPPMMGYVSGGSRPTMNSNGVGHGEHSPRLPAVLPVKMMVDGR